MERPEALLKELLRECPGLSKHVENLLEGKREGDLPGWPDDVLLPVAGWLAIAEHYTGSAPPALATMDLMLRLNAIGTWRYTKGIYRVPEKMMDALARTGLPEKLPMRVFRRLPEGCLYLEAPKGTETRLGIVFGWFVTLDYDYRSGAWELRIIEDLDREGLRLVPIELTETMCVKDAIATFATPEAMRETTHEYMLASVENVLKVLLYLCSDEPEIAGEEGPEARPSRPSIRRVKGRVRAFEQPRARIWTVGETMARAIELHEGSRAIGSGSRKAPHMRRAHWHGYWTGPRDGQRDFSYRWIPPVPVNEDLAATADDEEKGRGGR